MSKPSHPSNVVKSTPVYTAPKSKQLQDLPTELHHQIFSLVQEPVQLAIASSFWYAVSTTKSTQLLWLTRNVDWLGSKWMGCLCPRYNGSECAMGRLKSVDVRSKNFDIPQVIQSEEFVLAFVRMASQDIHQYLAPQLFLWGMKQGYATVVKDVLDKDMEQSEQRIPLVTLEACLFSSTSNGHSALVRAILAVRPEACSRPYLMATVAAKEGFSDIITLLLTTFPDLTFSPSFGLAMQLACEKGHVEAVRALLQCYKKSEEAAVPIREQAASMPSPRGLDLAAASGHVEVVKLLAEERYLWGAHQVLHSAQSRGQTAVVDILQRFCNAD